MTKRDAEVMVNAALASMDESLRAGESMEIRGFGSFGIRQRGARTSRIPATGYARRQAGIRLPSENGPGNLARQATAGVAMAPENQAAATAARLCCRALGAVASRGEVTASASP